MTRYSSTMTEALQEIREGFSPKQIKMAIGIASDKRYAGGNMTGAVQAIEKIKRGLSDHPQVAAVLKRQNEDLEEELDEGKMKDRLTKAQDLMGPSKNREQGIEFVMKGLKVSKKEATKLVDAVLDMVMNNEVEIDEMKMNDPKLNKIFDKLKRGDTVKLKTSSTISKGTDFVDYVVKAKNTVNKGRVEKITLVTKGNEKAVKKFLYKRDGQVTFAIGDMGASIDDIKEAAHALAEKLKVSDGVGAWIKDFQKSDAPQFQGKSEEDRKKMAIAAFADAGGKLEETELDEMKEPFVVVDTADGDKIVGTASSEKGAKEIITTAQLPPMKIKDKKTLKIVKVKKKQMIGHPIKEEDDEKKMDKPDSAKAVDQARDDKKKTRIAQLQLQIAKASEMINKLNSQEKPDA